MKSFALALAVLTAGSAAVAPSDLLVAEDVPDGFEQVAEPPTDLTFEDYAPLSPDATAHVDPDSPGALSMRAAVDVWTSADDDVLLREVTRWATEAEARAFVEQALVVGVQAGLDQRDPPFDGAVAFLGAEDGLWTRTTSWQQGRYAMSIAHFGVFESSNRIIDDATAALRDRVTDRTGQPVDAVDSNAPDAAPEAESPSDAGTGVGTVLLWVVVIGGVTWLIMRLRRRAAGHDRTHPRGRGRHDQPDADTRRDHQDRDHHDRDEPDDVDDIIERTRARRRAEREIDAIPDPTGWSPPDDR